MTTAINSQMVHSVDDVQDAVHAHEKLRIVGGNTKPALTSRWSQPPTLLDMGSLTGIMDYDPGEFTITARAGTTLAELRDTLAQHGQHMPFDPPLVDAGATLGGTIAAGVSGSGRHRYGSLRDFLIGVRFVDGQGRLVRGGGKVVKNAAGFDLPKLMIGSRGEFGVLVEASLKVFPEPPAYATVQCALTSLDETMRLVSELARSHFDLYALDVFAAPNQVPPWQITVRLGGAASLFPARIALLEATLPAGALTHLAGSDDHTLWADRRELRWTEPATWLVKCACTPAKGRLLEQAIATNGYPIMRLYTNGMNSLWLAGSGELAQGHELLQQTGLGGVVLRYGLQDATQLPTKPPLTPAMPKDTNLPDFPYAGRSPETFFHQQIRHTLDPLARFRD